MDELAGCLYTLLILIIHGMKYPLNVFGLEFSLWEVFVFGIVTTCIFELIGGIFHGK